MDYRRINWHEVDRRNTQDLNGKSIAKTCLCCVGDKNESFQFIRLRQPERAPVEMTTWRSLRLGSLRSFPGIPSSNQLPRCGLSFASFFIANERFEEGQRFQGLSGFVLSSSTTAFKDYFRWKCRQYSGIRNKQKCNPMAKGVNPRMRNGYPPFYASAYEASAARSRYKHPLHCPRLDSVAGTRNL